VHPAVRAEAGQAAEYSCAGETVLSRFLEKPFVERNALMAVRFADEDAQEVALARKDHGYGRTRL
jgi:hypothetical protein